MGGDERAAQYLLVLHTLWNAPFGLPIVAAFGIPADIAKCVALSLIAWIAALTFVQSGRKQIHQAQQAASPEQIIEETTLTHTASPLGAYDL